MRARKYDMLNGDKKKQREAAKEFLLKTDKSRRKSAKKSHRCCDNDKVVLETTLSESIKAVEEREYVVNEDAFCDFMHIFAYKTSRFWSPSQKENYAHSKKYNRCHKMIFVRMQKNRLVVVK